MLGCRKNLNAVMSFLSRKLPTLFFCLFITRVRPKEIMARLCTVRFLSAVRAMAARCKHPFALRPGLS